MVQSARCLLKMDPWSRGSSVLATPKPLPGMILFLVKFERPDITGHCLWVNVVVVAM